MILAKDLLNNIELNTLFLYLKDINIFTAAINLDGFTSDEQLIVVNLGVQFTQLCESEHIKLFIEVCGKGGFSDLFLAFGFQIIQKLHLFVPSVFPSVKEFMLSQGMTNDSFTVFLLQSIEYFIEMLIQKKGMNPELAIQFGKELFFEINRINALIDIDIQKFDQLRILLVLMDKALAMLLNRNRFIFVIFSESIDI